MRRTLLAGLNVAAELVGAREIAIGVKGKYVEVIDVLTPLLAKNMRIVGLSDSYPSGDEFILVHDVAGRIITPGGLPLDVGCVVINVETALNIGRGEPVVDKYLTVGGAVATPRTVRVPVGITYREAIDMAGGVTVKEPRIISGGVMMGALVVEDDPITKTCGGVIVVNADHVVARRYAQDWKQIARIGASACDQCSFCTEFCPRYLLGHPIEPHRAMRSLGFMEDRTPQVLGTQFCCGCNLCTMMACPEDLDPRSVCVHNKQELVRAGERWQAEAHPYRAAMHLDNRRVPIRRLILKLGLQRFENVGPLVDPVYAPRRVVLPLKQHVGVPAKAIVSSGERCAARGRRWRRRKASRWGQRFTRVLTAFARCATTRL